MRQPIEDERILRSRILAFIDEHCGSMTLQDAREWYNDAFLNDAAGELVREESLLNPP